MIYVCPSVHSASYIVCTYWWKRRVSFSVSIVFRLLRPRIRNIFAPENMNNMIIETIKRLSIDMFIAIMAIEAIVIAAIALSLLIGMFCK